MKSRFFLFYTCIFFIVLLSNCKKEKCNQHEIANLTFTQGDRSIIPYSGNEILVFKNTLGDSIVFEKGLKKITSNVDYEYTWHEALAHNDCRGDYVTSEKDEIDFYASVGKGYLQIVLSNSYSFDYPISKKYIGFTFFPGDTVLLAFAASYKFSNDTLFNKPDSIVTYHNQITIGPKTFFNVYELYTNYLNTPGFNEWYTTAFYSTIDGLVGLNNNYGRQWYLDKKR